MAKRIRFTDSEITTLAERFKEDFIRRAKASVGDYEYPVHVDILNNKHVVINITPTAWVKMQALVSEYSSEVEWYGLMKRENNTIELYDILNYPHTVSSCSVRGDYKTHEDWLFSLPQEQFKHLRMHGHSHVKMSVCPSSVDEDFRKDTIIQLPDDDMYLFMILNKKGDIEATFYDKQGNIMYESALGEIEFNIVFPDGSTMNEFLTEAKSLVKEERFNEFDEEYGLFQSI